MFIFSKIFIGLILSTAVLMLVCVVDDELSPRMKMSSSGEATKYSFVYGKSVGKPLNIELKGILFGHRFQAFYPFKCAPACNHFCTFDGFQLWSRS